MRARAACLSLSLAVVQFAFGADTNSVPTELIRKYEARQREDRIAHLFAGTTNGTWNLASSNLLRVTVIRGDSLWYHYSVKEDGSENDGRMTPYAAQDDQWKHLSAMELKYLREAILDLPQKSVSPPLDRTVLVGFRSGTNWVSRIYDSNDQPTALRRIYEIVGERWETKGER